ncbi:MAG: cysteine--tRNA ligase, partial [Candidatus Omnitrophota bacterium]
NKNIGDASFARGCAKVLRELTDIFGLSLEQKAESADAGVEALIAQRNAARKNKDFKRSDQIREELEAQGIILEDTKDSTTWRRKL